jgi:F0F1-type ATP synthase assembly protein I
VIAGVVIGGALGYLYYRFVGCASGACPITSNKYSATLYGALMGLILTMK